MSTVEDSQCLFGRQKRRAARGRGRHIKVGVPVRRRFPQHATGDIRCVGDGKEPVGDVIGRPRSMSQRSRGRLGT